MLLQAQDAVMSSGPSTQEAASRDAQLDQLDKIKQQLAEANEREEALQATVKKLQDEKLKQVASRGSSCRSAQPVLPTNAASSAQQQPQRAIAGANDFSFCSTPAPAHPASLESLQRPHVGQCERAARARGGFAGRVASAEYNTNYIGQRGQRGWRGKEQWGTAGNGGERAGTLCVCGDNVFKRRQVGGNS